MSNPKISRFIVLLLCLGICFRVILFLVNPPNNSYDDHMEVIQLYSEDFERPLPFECWQAYQPPAYYYIGAIFLKCADFLGLKGACKWKIVQSINCILSLLVLVLFSKILTKIGVNNGLKILYLSFLAFLPRDIFTSLMVGNDYLLIFSSVAVLFYFVKLLKTKPEISKRLTLLNFLGLSFFALLGSFTKQHGLLLLILPISITISHLYINRRFVLTTLMPILIVVLVFASSDELWKYKQTGHFLVSNQDYYDYAENQFPGPLNGVRFFSFELNKLLENPFISRETSASLPTEIFARIFFDYEWRFLNPNRYFTYYVGRLGYLLGIIWLLYFSISTYFWVKNNYTQHLKSKGDLINYISLFLVGILFTLVPVVQTIRYPYFSSMKAMFIVPGIIILGALHATICKNIKAVPNVFCLITIMNFLYGVILLVAICLSMGGTLDYLHGPLWPYPTN